MFEDFAGDVAFQDAGDLAHGLGLSEASSNVVAGGLVVSHPGDDDVEERRVGWVVPAPVETMPSGLPGAGRDGSDTTVPVVVKKCAGRPRTVRTIETAAAMAAMNRTIASHL